MVNFYSQQTSAEGNGIVIFNLDRVYGGDSSFLYYGSYSSSSQNEFSGHIEVHRFSDGLDAAVADHYQADLKGKLNGEYIDITLSAYTLDTIKSSLGIVNVNAKRIFKFDD